MAALHAPESSPSDAGFAGVDHRQPLHGWLEKKAESSTPRIRDRLRHGRATLFFDPRDPFRAGLPVGDAVA
jgi:hypothetical protein